MSRLTVSGLLSILDPEGVELRRRKILRRRKYYAKGPNYLWNVDSYDKLINYGICINPRIVAGHFISSVEKLAACPRKVRGDRGTENKHIEEIQSVLTIHGSFI